MRSNLSIITVLLAALFAGGASVSAQTSTGQGKGRGEGVGRGQGTGRGQDKKQNNEVMVPATATVNVTLSTGGGKISVHGWDKQEVRAKAQDRDATLVAHIAGGLDAANPATRVEILVSDKSGDEEVQYDSCTANSDVQLDVPRGATLYLKTLDGDIEVDDVAEIHVETSGGRVDLRRISKSTEATSVGGDITLEDASGRARLNALGAVIQIKNIRMLDVSDFLKIKTVSGDILLEGIGPARVEADTISGSVKLVGPLAHGGNYGFTTTIGDVTLELPADSSFKINARVSEGGEIITEFPLKYKGSTSPINLLHAGRVIGTYGSGDATINLVSFSGTLRLRKQ